MSIEHAPGRDTTGVRKLIRKRQLLELIPLSFPAIWEKMRRGEFPLPVSLGDGPNAPSAWYVDEILGYQGNLKRVEYKPADSTAEPEDDESEDGEPEEEAEPP